MISVKLFKVVLTLLFSLSSISIIKGQTTDSGYEFAQHPVSSVFSDNEIRLLQSTDSVTLTPLEFEKKMFDSWVKGRNDAIKDLAKNATATGVGLDVERVLEKNDENKLGMTPSEIENQVAFAYQLGGLHSINKALKASGHSIDVPKIRISTPEERQFMKLRQREMVRSLFQNEQMRKAQSPRSRWQQIQYSGSLDPLRVRSYVSDVDGHAIGQSIRYSSPTGAQSANVQQSSSIGLSPNESNEEYELIDNEEEEFNENINELDEINTDFEINQEGYGEPEEKRRHRRCPRRLTCRMCRQPRYRHCERCRRLKRQCRRPRGGDRDNISVRQTSTIG